MRCRAPRLRTSEGIAKAAGFNRTAGRVGLRIEEEDYGFAFEVREVDRVLLLILQGEIDLVIDFHCDFPFRRGVTYEHAGNFVSPPA